MRKGEENQNLLGELPLRAGGMARFQIPMEFENLEGLRSKTSQSGGAEGMENPQNQDKTIRKDYP